MTNITLFIQVIGQLPKGIIKSIIRKSDTDKHCKGYNTWSRLTGMIFCQFSNCGSVRDISNGLKSATGNLNHLGISLAPSKSTVTYRDAHRDSNVFRDIFYALFRHFGQQAVLRRKGFRYKMPMELLDSTLVSLTPSMYDWARYTAKKGAVGMHMLLDYDCLLPELVNITDGKVPDNKAAFDIDIHPFGDVVADRGYCDYALLNHWDSSNVSFVTRHKGNIRYKAIVERPLPEHHYRRCYGIWTSICKRKVSRTIATNSRMERRTRLCGGTAYQ